MDLVSFRELYGFMSGEKLAEIQEMQKSVGAHDVSRENAEAELFGAPSGGGAAPAADTATPNKAAPEAAAPKKAAPAPGTSSHHHPGVAPGPSRSGRVAGGKLQREEARSRVFPPDEVERGVVLNAAVILKDPRRSGRPWPPSRRRGRRTA